MSEPVGNSPRGAIPGNSHREREERAPAPQKEREKLEKIVEGEVIQRKQRWWKRFARGMIADDATSIGDFILVDVIIPTFKNTLRDIIVGTTDRSLYGAAAGPRRGGGPGYGLRGDVGGIRTKYNKLDEERPRMSRDAQRRHDFRDIILPNRSEAVDVIEGLIERVERYQAASVADLYDMLGISGSYADRNYGWTDLREANVRQYRGGWLLDLPQPDLLR